MIKKNKGFISKNLIIGILLFSLIGLVLTQVLYVFVLKKNDKNIFKADVSYIYDGKIYEDSYDYLDNYAYNWYLKNDVNKAKLYEELYLECVGFKHSDINLYTNNYDYSFFSKKYYNEYFLTYDEAVAVFKVLRQENPEFYWLNIFEGTHEDYLRFAIQDDYWLYSTRDKYDSIVESSLVKFDTEINKIGNVEDKVYKISNYIMDNMKYAYDLEGNPSNERWAHSIIGFFVRGEGVCESYELTFKYILDRYGINNIPVYGSEHGWNIVEINGIWYTFDLTSGILGYSDTYYKYLSEKTYDEYLFDVPKTANTCLSDYKMTLYENGRYVIQTRSIDLIYSKFSGKDYIIKLPYHGFMDSIYYLNEINDNYNSLTIESDMPSNQVEIYFYYDLSINKDITFNDVELFYIRGLQEKAKGVINVYNSTIYKNKNTSIHHCDYNLVNSEVITVYD